MDKLAAFAVVAVAVFAVGVGALAWRASAPPGPVVEVTIVNYAFSPDNVTIPVNTTVRWTNMDRVVHTVTFGHHGEEHAGEVDSGAMGHMAAFVYTFTEPGVYAYHCDPHPYMTGTVIVTA